MTFNLLPPVYPLRLNLSIPCAPTCLSPAPPPDPPNCFLPHVVASRTWLCPRACGWPAYAAQHTGNSVKMSPRINSAPPMRVHQSHGRRAATSESGVVLTLFYEQKFLAGKAREQWMLRWPVQIFSMVIQSGAYAARYSLSQSHSEVDYHKLSLYATRASVLSDMDAATVLLVHYVYNTICIITAMLNYKHHFTSVCIPHQ